MPSPLDSVKEFLQPYVDDMYFPLMEQLNPRGPYMPEDLEKYIEPAAKGDPAALKAIEDDQTHPYNTALRAWQERKRKEEEQRLKTEPKQRQLKSGSLDINDIIFGKVT